MGAPKERPGNEPASSGRARIRQRTEARLKDGADRSVAASGDEAKTPPLGTPSGARARSKVGRNRPVKADQRPVTGGASDGASMSDMPPVGTEETSAGDDPVIDLRNTDADNSSAIAKASDPSAIATESSSTAITKASGSPAVADDIDRFENVDPVDLGDDWTTAELPSHSAMFRLRRRASPGLDHLAAALIDTRRDLLAEVDRHRGTNPTWLDEAGRHFADATDACVSGRIESGWRSLRHANRLSIEGASEVGVHARIHALRAEVTERIPGWTGMAINQILDEAAVNQESNERRELVMRAAGLRDHSYSSTHHRQTGLRREITWSLLVLTASVLGIVVLALRDLVDFSDAPISSLSGWLAVGALLFGLSGASISAIQRVGRSTTRAHDAGGSHAASSPLRPMIGGAVALVATAAVAGGAIGPIAPTAPLIALLAFLAGFSERLGSNP